MNDSLKAVILEITSGNVRDHQIDLRGVFGMFSQDCLDSGEETKIGSPAEFRIGSEVIAVDIDEPEALFRETGAIHRFFETENIVEGDLVMLERLAARSFVLSKISKRAFNYHL